MISNPIRFKLFVSCSLQFACIVLRLHRMELMCLRVVILNAVNFAGEIHTGILCNDENWNVIREEWNVLTVGDSNV